MNVFFDVQEIYYLPQYLPIQAALALRGVKSTFVVYGDALDGVIPLVPSIHTD